MKSSTVAVWPETSWPGVEPGESQSFQGGQRKKSEEREFVSLGCCCPATLAKEVGGGRCSRPDVGARVGDLMESGASPSPLFPTTFIAPGSV